MLLDVPCIIFIDILTTVLSGRHHGCFYLTVRCEMRPSELGFSLTHLGSLLDISSGQLCRCEINALWMCARKEIPIVILL